PHGIETRFRDAQLSPVFGDLDGFVSAAQDTQYRALKYQIETLRYADPICGYIITELNDTQWEANGLLDARNNIRAFGNKLRALQHPARTAPRPGAATQAAGEATPAPVRAASAAPQAAEATPPWRFGPAPGTPAPPAGPSGSAGITLSITAPAA